MSKYKAGDKVVIEISGCESDSYYAIDKLGKRWFIAGRVDGFAEPLSEYTEKLEKKNENKQKRIEKLVERLHRQAAEITRLLAENAELKNSMEIIRDNSFEAGMIKGHEEAWELAQKIYCMTVDGGFKPRELIEIFGTVPASSILRLNTYTEAAAKVEEWERQNEICVGDVVSCEGIHGLVFGVGEVYIKGITPSCSPFQWHKQNCKKTGRHIDVDAWLALAADELERLSGAK